MIAQERADRSQDLDLLVAHGGRVERKGRFHRRQRHELQSMVLHDVAQGAGLVVVRAALLDADLLGHGDLHGVDEVCVPDRLEDRVGETEGQDVLDGLLAEVVVDPVNGVFGEHLLQRLRQLSRRIQV